MTDIEQRARDALNEVQIERELLPWRKRHRRKGRATIEAMCRQIEAMDAFRQEVSDIAQKAMTEACKAYGFEKRGPAVVALLKPLLIEKPDHRVAALRKMLEARGINNADDAVLADDFARLEAELAERGLEIVEAG